MGREGELFDKYMLIRQMVEAVRNKNTSKLGPLGDTTRGRGRVLALLKQKDGVSTKEMATVMGIRVSSLNEVLGTMEKDGYVERSASPDDRRVMLVWLTDKGKAVELPDQKMPEIIFGKLNQGAQNQLCMYFEQMISSLQNELGEEGDAVKEAREQRNEFFESAKQAHAEQPAQASQPAAQTQSSAAPRPAPAAPPVGSPLVPPIPPVSTPPRIG